MNKKFWVMVEGKFASTLDPVVAREFFVSAPTKKDAVKLVTAQGFKVLATVRVPLDTD